MEQHNYNKLFSKQMTNILEGHTQQYYKKTDGFEFNKFMFFHEFSTKEDTDILRDCYIYFNNEGKLIMKNNTVYVNLKDELDKINKYLFTDNKIEEYRRVYNQVNYYDQFQSMNQTDFDIDGEVIINDYKDDLNIGPELQEFIEERRKELQILHNHIRYFISLKDKIKELYELNSDLYDNITTKNDYNIFKQEIALFDTIEHFKTSRSQPVINDIINLSRNIGYTNDNIVFIKKMNKIAKVINGSDPSKIQLELLFDNNIAVTKSIDEIEPYLSLTKNKYLIDKVFNNINISRRELDNIKLECGLDINTDFYGLDINAKIPYFSTLTQLSQSSFSDSLPTINGLDSESLHKIMINIVTKTIHMINKTEENITNYELDEKAAIAYNMSKVITKHHIDESDVLIIKEYPKEKKNETISDSYSKFSLFYNHTDPLEYNDDKYPTINHLCYSNGVNREYIERFNIDSDMGYNEIINDSYKWGYHIKKIMAKTNTKKFGIVKNNLGEAEIFNDLKQIYRDLISNNSELEELLVGTGDKYIIYEGKDQQPSYLHAVYKDNVIYGFNLVGKYLMEIRDELLNNITESIIEAEDSSELIYFKNMSNEDYNFANKIISTYYLEQSLDAMAGSYYLETIDSLELKTYLDETRIGLYRYILNDACDVRVLANYGMVLEPFEILGRRYNSINHAIMGLKYLYYNDLSMSPYYTNLLKYYGKTFSIPEQGVIYDYDNYDVNSVEVLNLKPPINIDSIPAYWKRKSHNDIILGSIIHKYLLYQKFTKYPVFNDMAIKLSTVMIYDEIKNTDLIINYDIMDVFQTIVLSGSLPTDCYFTNILDYISNDKEEHYYMVIQTIINNIIHKNRAELLDNFTNIYTIVTMPAILDHLSIYNIESDAISEYLTENYDEILSISFKEYIERSHYEFINYINLELRNNDNNLEKSNQDLILNILKILIDSSVTKQDIPNGLDKLGVYYTIGENPDTIGDDNSSLEDPLELLQTRVLEVSKNFNNREVIPDLNGKATKIISKYKVVVYPNDSYVSLDENITSILTKAKAEFSGKNQNKKNISDVIEAIGEKKTTVNKINNNTTVILDTTGEKLALLNTSSLFTTKLGQPLFLIELDIGEEKRYIQVVVYHIGEGGKPQKTEYK